MRRFAAIQDLFPFPEWVGGIGSIPPIVNEIKGDFFLADVLQWICVNAWKI
jgi:hypothetical protein